MKNKKKIIWDIDELSIFGWLSLSVMIVLLVIGLAYGSIGCVVVAVIAFILLVYLIRRDCRFEDLEEGLPNIAPQEQREEKPVDERKPKTDLEDRDINEGNEYVQ